MLVDTLLTVVTVNETSIVFLSDESLTSYLGRDLRSKTTLATLLSGCPLLTADTTEEFVVVILLLATLFFAFSTSTTSLSFSSIKLLYFDISPLALI